jgi:hypothetical protein
MRRAPGARSARTGRLSGTLADSPSLRSGPVLAVAVAAACADPSSPSSRPTQSVQRPALTAATQQAAPPAYFDVTAAVSGIVQSNGFYPQGEYSFHLVTGGQQSASKSEVFGYYAGGHSTSGSIGSRSASLDLSTALVLNDASLRGGTGSARYTNGGGRIKVYVLGPPGTPYTLQVSWTCSANASVSASGDGGNVAGSAGGCSAGVGGPGSPPQSDSKSGTDTYKGTSAGPTLSYANRAYSYAGEYGTNSRVGINTTGNEEHVTAQADARGAITVTVTQPSGGPPPPPDADGDGVPDSRDQCPGTAAGAAVDANGCSQDQLDDCPSVVSSGQAASSHDGAGDACPLKKPDLVAQITGFYNSVPGREVHTSTGDWWAVNLVAPLTIDVRNIGTARSPSTTIRVKMTKGATTVDLLRSPLGIEPLDPGQSASVAPIDLEFPGGGEYLAFFGSVQITLEVDPANTVAETNDSNNSASRPVLLVDRYYEWQVPPRRIRLKDGRQVPNFFRTWLSAANLLLDLGYSSCFGWTKGVEVPGGQIISRVDGLPKPQGAFRIHAEIYERHDALAGDYFVISFQGDQNGLTFGEPNPCALDQWSPGYVALWHAKY